MTIGKVVLNLPILHRVLNRAQVSIGFRTITHLNLLRYEIDECLFDVVVNIFVDVEPLSGVAKLCVVLESCPEELGG